MLIYFKAENNEIFRVNYETLTSLATGLKELLEVLSSTDSQLGTEVNPIYLPGKPSAIRLFLQWIEHP